MLATIGFSLAIFNNNKNTELLIKNKTNEKQQKTQEENLKLSNQAQKNVLKAQLKTFQIKLNKLKKEFKGYFNKGEIETKLQKFVTKTDLASKLDTNQLLAEINKLDFKNPTLKNKLLTALETKFDTLASKTALADKLSKSELLDEIKSLLNIQDSLKTAIAIALQREFKDYFNKGEIETKLQKFVTKTDLASKLDTNQLLAEINKLDFKKPTLKNKLLTALKTKFDTLASKTALADKLFKSELLDEIKSLLDTQDSLKSKIALIVFRWISGYYEQLNNLENKLQKIAAKKYLLSKIDINQLLLEINKLDFKNPTLKNKLIKALKTNLQSLTKNDLTVEKSNKKFIENKLSKSELLNEIKTLLKTEDSLKNALITALETKFDTLASKTALADKLSKSELLDEIKSLLNTQDSLKTAIAIALYREFKGYFNKGEIETKLQKFVTKTDLASKLDTNQLLAEINKLDFKNPTLKNKLLTALETKFDTLASKTALASKLDTNQLLAEIRTLLSRTSLGNWITFAINRSFNRYYQKEELTKLKELERFLIKTDQTTPEIVKTVINQIVRTKLIEHIFTKWIQKFQSLSNIDSTNDLSNTDGSKNLFYKLAPFLFESPNQANQKLNKLLTGSLTKRNKWAIWATRTGFWKIGKLSELIKENDWKYQKVVFRNNKWVVKTNSN